MKRYLVGIVLLMTFVGCRNNNQLIEKEVVNILNKNENWDINITYPQFSSTNEKTDWHCKRLNDEISVFVNNLQDTMKTEANELFQSLENSTIGRPSWRYEMVVQDSVFMSTDKFISVRLIVYTFTGGAHGMTKFYAFNYDMEHQNNLLKKDILDEKRNDEINITLKNQFRNSEKCFTDVPTFHKASVINVSPENICFTYEHYILGPYSCGYCEISVPRNELKKAVLIK